MKRKEVMFTITRTIVLFATTLPFAMVAACAEQPSANETANEQPVTAEVTSVDTENEPERLVKIARLETPKANDEFTQNVQIMQARVREVANLTTLLEQEEDADAKLDIQFQIDELMRRLNDDDKLMVDTYRYSLSRRYIRNIENATVLLILDDEEVDNIRKEAEFTGEEVPESLNSNLLSICTLNTPEAAQGFQRDVAAIQTQRDLAVQLQTGVEAAETSENRAYSQGRLDQVLGQLNDLNAAMVNAYGFSINRNYIMRINVSSLYIWANEDELVETAKAE